MHETATAVGNRIYLNAGRGTELARTHDRLCDQTDGDLDDLGTATPQGLDVGTEDETDYTLFPQPTCRVWVCPVLGPFSTDVD